MFFPLHGSISAQQVSTNFILSIISGLGIGNLGDRDLFSALSFVHAFSALVIFSSVGDTDISRELSKNPRNTNVCVGLTADLVGCR